MRYPYVIVDVFSSAPFGGNQLAVLTDASGLSTAGMQAITREFNFAETTFVLPAEDSACVRRVRIFTPGKELPFAGHPTVGTAAVLVMAGISGEGSMILEEEVGPVPVRVERRDGVLHATLSLEQPPELNDEGPDAAKVATVLSIDRAEVADVFCAGAGVRFTFVRLRSREAVDRARLNAAEWECHFAARWAPQIFFFAGDLVDGSEIYARMFAPAFGIREDAATGSAVAALAGVAALRARAGLSLRIIQGVAMGRPSLLEASADVDGGKVCRMKVTGAAAFVAEGQIEVPESFLER